MLDLSPKGPPRCVGLHSNFLLPQNAVWVVAKHDEPSLRSTLLAAAAASSAVVLLTDDIESLPPGLDLHLLAVEPESLVPDGASNIGEAWDQGVHTWVDYLFPGHLDGLAIADIVRVNIVGLPLEMAHRVQSVALADTLFSNYRPVEIRFAGPLPYYCDTVEAEAQRRGVPSVRKDIRAKRLAHFPAWLRHFGRAAALLGGVPAEAFSLFRHRRGAASSLASLVPAQGKNPVLWIAINPVWSQPLRNFINGVVRPLEEAGIPYGVVFVTEFALSGRRQNSQTIQEKALFDGTFASLRPAAIEQAAAVTSFFSLALSFFIWLPLACNSVFRAMIGAHCLRIGTMVGSVRTDLSFLLRIATRDLWRTIEAQRAAKKWLKTNSDIRRVVFNLAAPAEAKIVDLEAQRAGATTFDVPHGYPSEANIRTGYRTMSSYVLAWTNETAQRYAALGSNGHCLGGFMPQQRAVRTETQALPLVLILSGYVTFQCFQQYEKYARRLAQAVAVATEALSERARFVVRLHPLADRAAWDSHFTGKAPTLSRESRLSSDLANADIVITTMSSSFIEALLYEVPLLVHRAPIIEPETIFSHVHAQRWFSEGQDLKGKLSALLGSVDLTPEHQLSEMCFGPRRSPRVIADFLSQLGTREESPASS